jgi:hypothetical protein
MVLRLIAHIPAKYERIGLHLVADKGLLSQVESSFFNIFTGQVFTSTTHFTDQNDA